MRCPICHKNEVTAAHIMGHDGGKATGESKSRSEQLKAYWASAKGIARRKRQAKSSGLNRQLPSAA